MSQRLKKRDLSRAEDARAATHTLAVDVGGTRIKASVLDAQGNMLAPELQVATPAVPAPPAVEEAIEHLASQLPPFSRISIGFPGVVRRNTVVTAPNLGTERWAGYKLAECLGHRFGVPARMLNDAAVQGLGVVGNTGLETVMTLGTGVGCAVFRDGLLLLPMEFGQHRARKRLTYDHYIGQAALVACGPELWNKRVQKAVAALISLTSCERLSIGGGNARLITAPMPVEVRIVSNIGGITGGVRLWEPGLDRLFDPPSALETAT